MEKKLLPVGISDYKELIDSNCYYVDKTLLVEEIMLAGKVILITRPRRFGKTLNQSMVRYFFENTNEDNSYLFTDKKIWQNEKLRKMQGKYPVIYLTFKDVKSNNYSESYESVKFLISKEYKRHKLVMKKIEEKNEREVYQKIIDRKASIIDYQFSLLNLSEYLFNYYEVKPLLLIDEYDTPIIAAYNHKYYDDFINFYKILLGSVLKDNIKIEKSVLTGITRVAKESIFSDVNNLKVSTVFSDFYNDKFGLSQGELIEILDYYNLKLEKNKIIAWYSGYNMGGKKLYNPFSIVNLIDNKGKIQEYWINTSNNVLVKDLIRKSTAGFKDGFINLINAKEIEADIEENLVFSDIDGSEENIWTLLLFSGYLTWVKNIKDRKYKLKVPNQEVMSFYKHAIKNILKDKNIVLDNMINTLLLGHIKEFKKMFKELTKRVLSYFDTQETEPERFYHGLVLGMVVGLKEKYIVKSNRESGYGRVDVVLIPRRPKETGLILEFKNFNIDEDKSLRGCANKALSQIDDSEYETILISHGVGKIIKVGIAFKGKKVKIASNLDSKKEHLSEKEQIALNLLKSGVALEIIAKTTGLQKKEIKELEKANH